MYNLVRLNISSLTSASASWSWTLPQKDVRFSPGNGVDGASQNVRMKRLHSSSQSQSRFLKHHSLQAFPWLPLDSLIPFNVRLCQIVQGVNTVPRKFYHTLGPCFSLHLQHIQQRLQEIIWVMVSDARMVVLGTTTAQSRERRIKYEKGNESSTSSAKGCARYGQHLIPRGDATL